MKNYYVYILASKARGTLYVGISNSLERRYFEHVNAQNPNSFSARYRVKRLVYFEQTDSIEVAIHREKQLKKWHRQWKINLVESTNPAWHDLSKSYRMDAETSSA
ncbi:GIY-YIG nuclease family protein [Candidatus Saccharibacteria bacterium]|nr:GIY-YIG nuclease family protein [Candidatus Saccharibacteria bacterium]